MYINTKGTLLRSSRSAYLLFLLYSVGKKPSCRIGFDLFLVFSVLLLPTISYDIHSGASCDQIQKGRSGKSDGIYFAKVVGLNQTIAAVVLVLFFFIVMGGNFDTYLNECTHDSVSIYATKRKSRAVFYTDAHCARRNEWRAQIGG